MKAIFLYILIIGLLFVGLLGVLKIGEGLQAPFDVSGEWNIDEKFAQSIEESCFKVSLPAKNPKVQILQSGIHLTLFFNDSYSTKLWGRIEGRKLNFETVLKSRSNSAYCNDYVNLNLSIELNKQKDKDELVGIWLIKDCQDCPELKFSAVRDNNLIQVRK